MTPVAIIIRCDILMRVIPSSLPTPEREIRAGHPEHGNEKGVHQTEKQGVTGPSVRAPARFNSDFDEWFPKPKHGSSLVTSKLPPS